MNAVILGSVALLVLVFLARRLLVAPGEGTLSANRIGSGLKRLQRQMETHRALTPDALAQTSDEELLEAVLANLWAKMAPGLSDARIVMAAQSRPRQLLYAVYETCGQAREQKFDPFPPEAQDAAECLREIGATQSAELLDRALQTPNERPLLWEPFLEAFEAEQGKERLVNFVRTQANAFCDVDAPGSIE